MEPGAGTRELVPVELLSVTVIIPAYRGGGLEECLAALNAQSYLGKMQVVVVDNGENGALDHLLLIYSGTIVAGEGRAGSYYARNTGVEAANGAILAFTDADCVPDPGWIAAGVAAVSEKGGIVGGRIDMVYEFGRAKTLAELYDACTCFPQKISISLRGYSVTANLFVSRKDFELAGRFNPVLRSGGDREFCERAVRRGVAIGYEPKAVVRHRARDTNAAIVQRVWRIQGGVRDVDPNWRGCLRQIGKCFLPPFLELHPMLGERKAMSSWGQKFLIFWYAWGIRLLRAYARLVLQISCSESARI